jgi:hypothetical protein
VTRLSRSRQKKKRRLVGEEPPEASEPGLVSKKRIIVAVPVLVVVGALVGFSLYRYYRVEEPARVLERWATATRDGDCDASYDALSKSVKDVSVVGEKENWCQLIGSPNFIGTLTVEETLRSGSKACVVAEVHNPDQSTQRKSFILVLEDGDWKVDLGSDPATSGVEGCPST